MPTVAFKPGDQRLDVEPNTKLLAAANRAKVGLRFGCAACRCGTCGIAVGGDGELSAMKADEKALLGRMGLALDGSVRLACQARITAGTTIVDLDYQLSYSPDEGDDSAS